MIGFSDWPYAIIQMGRHNAEGQRLETAALTLCDCIAQVRGRADPRRQKWPPDVELSKVDVQVVGVSLVT